MKQSTFLCAAALLLSLTSGVRGDATVISKNQSGLGEKLSIELMQVNKFQGLRSRKETQSHVDISTRSVDNHTATLTLLDQGLIIELNLNKQSYTQQTVQEAREKIRHLLEQTKKIFDKMPGSKDPARSEWSVTPTKATRIINGYSCQEYRIQMRTEMGVSASSKPVSMEMVLTQWTTPETAELKAAQKEEQDFYARMGKELGIEPESIKPFGTALLNGLIGKSTAERDKTLARFATEMKKVQGYPISSHMEWKINGRLFTSSVHEVQSISTAKIADSEFKVPSHFQNALIKSSTGTLAY